MAFHPSAGQVLTALGYEPVTDCGIEADGTLTWYHSDPQPTEQQLNDWATDTTPLPSGQLFSVWRAEHGGDATLTAKRIAKEIFDQSTGEGVLLRSIMELVRDELNILRSQHSLASRTNEQIKTALLAKINAAS